MYPGRKPRRLTAPAPPKVGAVLTLYEPTSVILDSWKLGPTMRPRRFAHSETVPSFARCVAGSLEPAGRPPLQAGRNAPSQRAASAFDSIRRTPSARAPTASLSGGYHARPDAAFAIEEAFGAGSSSSPEGQIWSFPNLRLDRGRFNDVSARCGHSCERWSRFAEARA